jgi:hypothetical protein
MVEFYTTALIIDTRPSSSRPLAGSTDRSPAQCADDSCCAGQAVVNVDQVNADEGAVR